MPPVDKPTTRAADHRNAKSRCCCIYRFLLPALSLVKAWTAIHGVLTTPAAAVGQGLRTQAQRAPRAESIRCDGPHRSAKRAPQVAMVAQAISPPYFRRAATKEQADAVQG